MKSKTSKTVVVAILLALSVCMCLPVFVACNDGDGNSGTDDMTSEELFAFYRQEIVDMGYSIALEYKGTPPDDESGISQEWYIHGNIDVYSDDEIEVMMLTNEDDLDKMISALCNEAGVSDFEEFNDLLNAVDKKMIVDGCVIIVGTAATADALAAG